MVTTKTAPADVLTQRCLALLRYHQGPMTAFTLARVLGEDRNAVLQAMMSSDLVTHHKTQPYSTFTMKGTA